MKRAVAPLAVLALLVPSTAAAHPSRATYVERAVARAFSRTGEMSTVKRLAIVMSNASSRWDRLDARWQEARAEIPVPVVVEAPYVGGGTAPYCGSSCVACESGGNPQALSSTGKYWGLYQYDYSSWVADGGSPSTYGRASAAEQHAVAARAPFDRWPNC